MIKRRTIVGPFSVTCRQALLWGSTLVLLGACSAGGAPKDAAAPAAAAPMGDAMPGMQQAQPPGFMPPPGFARARAADPPAPAPAAVAERDDDRRGAAKPMAPPPPPMWAPVRQFPVPSYGDAYEGPRTDFRETVFWAPQLRTDARGEATVRFFLSDAVTSFRATAQGLSATGTAGRGEALLSSKLPVSMAAKLPLEVTRGDFIELPVTITNTTPRARTASVRAAFGAAFTVKSPISPRIQLGPKQQETLYVPLEVTGAPGAGAGKIELAVESGQLGDGLARTVRVVAAGFPREESRSGTLETRAREEIDVPEALPGTLEATLAFYPSPTATLVAGTEAMIAEPSGCFEQASSTNYPNVMVMKYLKEHGKADTDLVARTEGMLDRGYKKLAGYESKGKGYEWFGADPGHEALTAYGLLQFADMKGVYTDVDAGMIERTRAWLRAKRDGKGGYVRNARALDSFGAASEEVTNAYITYALTEAGERDVAQELGYVKRLASSHKDPYVLALATNALLNAERGSTEAKAAVARLVKMQKPEGRWTGADHSITRSGGVALDIETTALATLALMKSPEAKERAIQQGVDWIGKQSSGGSFGSTQSTVLALKVLTRAAEGSRTPPEGTVTLTINGGAPRQISLDPNKRSTALSFDIAKDLKPGKNVIEISASNKIKLPYGVTTTYRTLKPASSARTAVQVAATLASTSVRAGEPVKVKASVANVTGAGIPMVVARIGIPGGTTFQTWQLDELKAKGLIDYYETREREVIVYFRSMAPRAKKAFDLDLLATVPGRFSAPASSAYLYYTDEHKQFAEPLAITVTR